MSPITKFLAGLAISFVLGSAAFAIDGGPTAEAKEYNKGKSVPSDSQALVNRIQAQMSSTNTEGEFGSRESNCDELNVGANTEGSRPDEQVIIADKIVNVGGQCRMIRNQGGFKPAEPAGKAPAKKQ
jgi:hypothetical protein